jgi:hypothetical protein
MHIQHETRWRTINLAELRFGLTFGASVEELGEFLFRVVEHALAIIPSGSSASLCYRTLSFRCGLRCAARR